MQALFEGVLKDRRLWQKEIFAGITAFFAISYIIVVNPIILADAGMPAGRCVPRGLSWPAAIAISLVAGLIFAYVACTKWRDRIAHAVPNSLKCAITAGIGLFLVEIGLEKAQLIRSGANSIIELGSLTNPMALLALFGLVLSLALYLRGVTGSFFIAILVTTAVAQVFGIKDPTPLPRHIPHSYPSPQLLLPADIPTPLRIPFLLSVFSMSMIMIFETMGLLEGILPDRSKFSRTFRGSAVTTIISSLLGTSPTVAAAESAAGIASGGRTGLMALTAAVLFAVSLFFIPLLSYVPQAAISPVIIITGAMMMQQLQHMDFQDFSEWFPAFLVVVLIPLSGSISTGLAFGFTAYPLLKLMNGRSRELHALRYTRMPPAHCS